MFLTDLVLACADNVDLGTACGKYFRVATLAITDPGTCLYRALLAVASAAAGDAGGGAGGDARLTSACSLQQVIRTSSAPAPTSKEFVWSLITIQKAGAVEVT